MSGRVTFITGFARGQGRSHALLLEPVDINNAVLYLESDEARYVTGISSSVGEV